MWTRTFLIYFLFRSEGAVAAAAPLPVQPVSPSAVNQRLICPVLHHYRVFVHYRNINVQMVLDEKSSGIDRSFICRSRSFISHFRRFLDNEVDRGGRDRPVIPPRPAIPAAESPLEPLIFICHFANEISASNLRRVAVPSPFPGNSQLRALWGDACTSDTAGRVDYYFDDK